MKHKSLFVLVIGSMLAAGPFCAAKPGGGNGGGGPKSDSIAPVNTPPMAHPPTPALKDADPARGARSAAPAAQRLSDSMHDINQTAFAQRKELLDNVDMRLQSSREELRRIQSEAKDARADAHADFKAALADLKAREKDLDAAVKASRKADEANWETRRSVLAKASQDFNDSLARLDAVRIAPPAPKLP